MGPPNVPQALQSLSPERVNRKRPESVHATSKSANMTRVDDNASIYNKPISPDKVDLFAEYISSTTHTPKKSGYVFPQSPSLSEIHAIRGHNRTNSDVQGLVKRFEHLDVRDREAESQERRKKHEAELRRAQIAREEAESDVKRLRAELRANKKDIDDGRERERKVAKRLEVVMEEFANAKEAQAAASAVYEKEIRKVRKEAFKSSSAVLKLQEELKSARTTLRVTQSAFDLEKQKVERRDQETFNAQFQLLALQDELDKMRDQMKIIQEEKEALKIAMKEEEVARVAAEGLIALPTCALGDDEFQSSPTQLLSPLRLQAHSSHDKENIQMSPKKSVEDRRRDEDLSRERIQRVHAEEMIEFMNLECLFKCCSCSIRSGQSCISRFPQDLTEIINEIMADARPCLYRDDQQLTEDAMQIDHEAKVLEAQVAMQIEKELDQATADLESPPVVKNMSPHSRLHDDEPSAAAQPYLQREHEFVDREDAEQTEQGVEDAVDMTQIVHPPSETVPLETAVEQRPITPLKIQPSVRTITTTTTIPMQFTPASKSSTFHDVSNVGEMDCAIDDGVEAPVIDRAAALAAIQYRRGRAKSIANGHITPRKQMMQGTGLQERRDVSAPILGSKSMASINASMSTSTGKASKRLT